ncbi:sigma-54-dependent Fis family transcriptional regulator [bacterium]|nr:sigma-54-dependent Fis family transcriptional regulator [bacterium]
MTKTPISEMPDFIGQSSAFMQLIESIRQVAPTQITVLITGESGTGKEMIARAIHHLSQRKNHPLINVNCGAIPEGILESELFGHVKGAFTGALETRKGYFELANGGTIFLDEIGEMPLSTQVKLLRVLESQSFMRVGGSTSIQVDVRVIAASNKDLEKAVKHDEFRKDLFYRLNAVHLSAPPLRKRREDIQLLTQHFAERICSENRIQCPEFTEEAMYRLSEYHWPGNIRELRNIVERLIIFEKGQTIDGTIVQRHLEQPGSMEQQLPMVINKTTDQAERELIYRALLDIRVALEDLRRLVVTYHERSIAQSSWTPSGKEIIPNSIDHDTPILTIQELEKQQIEKALIRFRHNRRRAAKALGIGERTLYRKLKEYGLE